MSFNETTLKDYLLGTLSAEETEKIELQIFDDPELVSSLALAEDDLIEDYIDETLTPGERELFQKNFLTSSRRREQFDFLKRLKSEAAKSAPRMAAAAEKTPSLLEKLAKMFRPGLPQIAVFASLAVVFALFAWWLVGSRALSGFDNEIAALNKTDLSDLSVYQNASTLTLTTDTLRSAGAGKNLPKDLLSENVLLRLALRDDPASVPLLEIYRSETRVLALEDVRVYRNPAGSEIRLLVPASVLEKGVYRVELAGGGGTAIYNFSIQ